MSTILTWEIVVGVSLAAAVVLGFAILKLQRRLEEEDAESQQSVHKTN